MLSEQLRQQQELQRKLAKLGKQMDHLERCAHRRGAVSGFLPTTPASRPCHDAVDGWWWLISPLCPSSALYSARREEEAPLLASAHEAKLKVRSRCRRAWLGGTWVMSTADQLCAPGLH